MADLVDKAHIDAAPILLRADAGLVVYPDAEGNTPLAPSPPYVRWYASIERPPAPSNALTGYSATWITRWYFHCVGATEYAAAAAAMRVRAALLDVRPTISGRSCSLIRQDADIPPQRDESTGTTVFDAVVVYALTTTG